MHRILTSHRKALLAACLLVPALALSTSGISGPGDPPFGVIDVVQFAGGGTAVDASSQLRLDLTIGEALTGTPVDGSGTIALRLGFWNIVEPSAPIDIPGDTNGDGEVNVDDLIAVILGWGACAAPCPPSCPADVAPIPGGNCAVDVDDLITVILNWG